MGSPFKGRANHATAGAPAIMGANLDQPGGLAVTFRGTPALHDWRCACGQFITARAACDDASEVSAVVMSGLGGHGGVPFGVMLVSQAGGRLSTPPHQFPTNGQRPC